LLPIALENARCEEQGEAHGQVPGDPMGVEVITNHANELCFWLPFINRPFQLLSAINHCSAIRNFDIPPAGL
jgi:hypothetical protein